MFYDADVLEMILFYSAWLFIVDLTVIQLIFLNFKVIVILEYI